MLKVKRAQAALEFLMTYGWAILVVLIVISALAYFGVLNPENMLPPRCTMPVGLSCKDYIVLGSAATDNVTLKLVNGQSSAITVTYFNATPGNGNPYTGWCSSAALQTIQGNVDGIVTGNCSTLISNYVAGKKYRWNINLRYYSADSSAAFTKTVSGELFAPVE